jgi:acetyl esterase/lipase
MSARDEAAARFRGAFPDLKDAGGATIEQLRLFDDKLWNSLLPEDAIVEQVDAGAVKALWVSTPGASEDRAVIWFHGGGYSIGSAEGRRAIAAEVSRVAGCRVLVVDYRLAPEHPFPAAVEDAVEAFGWVAERIGPSAVVLGGDSAGGGLALAALLALRDKGAYLPGGAAVLSPLSDWTLSGESHQLKRDVDEFVTREMLEWLRDGYVGDHDPSHSWVSPALGDYSGLPPLLVLVGSHETLLDDARMVAAAAESAGTEVTLQVFDDMFHLWPMFSSMLPQGQEAIDQIGAFVRARLG